MRRRGEDGFALIATLWFVVLLALVAVVVEGWVTTALDRATALKARITDEQALIETVDRAVLAMLTAGFGAGGLEPPARAGEAGAGQSSPARSARTPSIALDGRPYRIGDVVVRLQDEGGLYDLSNPSRSSLTRLLQAGGVSAADGDAMAIELGRYQAAPAASQADTGRDADYGAAGLPPPRHSRLVSPWEPYRILDWPHSAALWRGAPTFADLVTTGPVGGLDINTAPAAVLMALTGIDEGDAARLISARRATPITDAGALLKTETTVGSSIDRPPEIMPSNIIRLRLQVAGDPRAHIVSIRLTPDATTPYRLDFWVDRPLSAGDRQDEETAVAPLPILSYR